MGKYRASHTPWQMISMDLLGPFPRSRQGNSYLLVFSDWFTKYPCIIPLRSAVARNIVKHTESRIFLEYGVPQSIIMDNGSQFSRSKEVQALLKKYGINRLWSNCIYHAQSNYTERHNKNINAALRAYVKENHRTWDEQLPEISLALRTSVNSVTKYSPFFLNHGREFVFHASDYELNPIPSSEADPIEERSQFLKRFKEISSLIIKRMEASYQRNKKQYDRNRSAASYQSNDPIFYRNFTQSDAAKSFCKKLAPIFMPGSISKVISEMAYEVSNSSGKLVGKFHIQDLRPRVMKKPNPISSN